MVDIYKPGKNICEIRLLSRDRALILYLLITWVGLLVIQYPLDNTGYHTTGYTGNITVVYIIVLLFLFQTFPSQNGQKQPLCYFTLSNSRRFYLSKREPLGGKGLTEPVCPSLFLNPFPPRLTKSGHYVILLCLTPDDFTRQMRASGWERVLM